MDDQQLVERVIQGDKTAFSFLIRKYQRLVASILFRILEDERDREELAQDIFIRIYQKLSEFRFESKLSTWIATITYREGISQLRKRKSIQEESLDFSMPGIADKKFENEDLSRFLKIMIDKLPHQYAVILTLYHIEGFSYPEIVEITDLPEGTVKNYLFRARKKLKEMLTPYLDKEKLLYG